MREPNIVRSAPSFAFAWAGVLLLTLGPSGCSVTSTPLGTELTSRENGLGLTLSPTLTSYAARDRNTADFYMTDLPAGAWNKPSRELSGTLVHVHVFLLPKPGSTPIADDACSFTVRQIVFTGGSHGVYSGGGFLTLSGDVGDRECGGEFRGATLRLTSCTDGFEDRLGPGEMRGRIEAPRDESSSNGWASLVSRSIHEAKEQR